MAQFESRAGGLAQGLSQGMGLAMNFDQMQQQKKQRDLQMGLSVMADASRDIANKKLPKTYRAAKQKQYNAGVELFNKSSDVKLPLSDGNLDDTDIDYYKMVPDVIDEATRFASEGKTSEIPKLFQGLSEDIANSDPEDAKKKQSILSSALVSKMQEPSITAPARTPGAPPATALTPEMKLMLDNAKVALAGNPEALKQIQEMEQGKQARTANAFAQDFQSQPKGSWQQKVIQDEATKSQFSNADEFRKSLESQRKIQDSEHRQENQGIDADTGYMLNGEPVLRNTRTRKYFAGDKEANSLEGLEKSTGGYAYKKEGLKSKDEEALVGAVKAYGLLTDADKTLKSISMGVPKIGEAKNALKRYMSDKDAIAFDVARDQLALASQEIIKGIPSDFDVKNFQKTLPSADKTYAENKQRIEISMKLLKQGFKSKIQNLKKARMPIPVEVQEIADTLGIWGGKVQAKKEEVASTGGKTMTYNPATGAFE